MSLLTILIVKNSHILAQNIMNNCRKAMMKKEIPYKNADQKRQRSNVDIKARKSKRESIEDIHLHRKINLIAILMG